MASDPACARIQVRVTSESILVDNGGLQNVFVYIKDGLGNQYVVRHADRAGEAGSEGLPLHRRTSSALRATQPLEVVNSDNTLHNVHGDAGRRTASSTRASRCRA